jgi:hypothetical protein
VGSGFSSVAGSEGSSSVFTGVAFLNLGAFLIVINKTPKSTRASTIPTTMRPIEVAPSFDGHC